MVVMLKFKIQSYMDIITLLYNSKNILMNRSMKWG